MKIKLQRVHYIPKDLDPETLYFSEEFGIAIHLCPCGCESKIKTPIGPTDWRLTIDNNKPSLYPSVGNWQIPCKSHYWITDGEIVWAPKWTSEQIEAGRKAEEERAQVYYDNIYYRQKQKIQKLFRLIGNLLRLKF